MEKKRGRSSYLRAWNQTVFGISLLFLLKRNESVRFGEDFRGTAA